jgi:hypothetical protein
VAVTHDDVFVDAIADRRLELGVVPTPTGAGGAR